MFYEVSQTVILKPEKNITRKKITDYITRDYRYKNLLENISKSKSAYIKRILRHDQVGFIQEYKIGLIFFKKKSII